MTGENPNTVLGAKQAYVHVGFFMSFSYLRATERPEVKMKCPGSGCRTLSSVLPDHSWDLDMELIYVWRK